MSRIGSKIKEERTKKGLSAKQLGKKCGVTESFILEIESGRKVINEKFLTQLSKALGINLEENMVLEPAKEEREPEEKILQKVVKPTDLIAPKREIVQPLDHWGDALSNIIKKIPIYDMEMKEAKGYKSFPIIEKKVEGFHPDKLIYIEVGNDDLNGFRIRRGDKVFIYLNTEIVNNAIALVEYEGKRRLRKIKRVEGNKLHLISHHQETKTVTLDIKDVKILGRCIRVEIDL